jgi:hypothetical protein
MTVRIEDEVTCPAQGVHCQRIPNLLESFCERCACSSQVRILRMGYVSTIKVPSCDGNSLKTGACGDDPNGVIWAAGCQGGMKLKIPNPGVSGEASTAPLYARFCRSRTYNKVMRTDARTNTMTRTTARAITAADMVDCWLCVF